MPDFDWLGKILDGLYCYGLMDALPDYYKPNGTELTRQEAKDAIQERFISLQESYETDAAHHKKGLELLAKQHQADLLRARIDERQKAITQLSTIYRDCVRNDVLTREGLIGYHSAIEDAIKDRDERSIELARLDNEPIKIVSLFTGAGGLDLGFEKAGFSIIYANEFDKKIWATFNYNFPHAILDKRNVTKIPIEDIPDCDGIVGGPPCQSWSVGGAGRGITDQRGQLFNDYIRILKAKQPRFFLAENVSGILNPKHSDSFKGFLEDFENAGYNISWKLVDANDYNVPENRLRVIIVGFRKDLHKTFIFPDKKDFKPTLRDAISDLPEAIPALLKNKTNGDLDIPNHEYMIGGFSSIYMSRNRVRGWDEPSFTIQAAGRQAPIHPKAPKMTKIEPDVHCFAAGLEERYRRLSVRECARIQTFPDTFIFRYTDIADGYKMIGNAVPVNLAEAIAKQILWQLNKDNNE